MHTMRTLNAGREGRREGGHNIALSLSVCSSFTTNCCCEAGSDSGSASPLCVEQSLAINGGLARESVR